MFLFALGGLFAAGCVGRFIGGNYGLCVVILILLAIFNPADRSNHDTQPTQTTQTQK